MRLSEKFDRILALHSAGTAASEEDRLPLVSLAPGELATASHGAPDGRALPYLFERGSGVHSPWISSAPDGRHHNFIGAHSYMNSGGYLRDNVLIGRFCSVGRRVTLGAGMHEMGGLSTSPRLSARRPGRPGGHRPARGAFTILDSDVWIGDGAVVLPGLRLGLGCVIGANAVLTRDTVPYGIYAGTPARLIRRRFPDALCDALVESRWWDLPVEALKGLPLDDPADFLSALEDAGEVALAEEPTFVVAAEGGRAVGRA